MAGKKRISAGEAATNEVGLHAQTSTTSSEQTQAQAQGHLQSLPTSVPSLAPTGVGPIYGNNNSLSLVVNNVHHAETVSFNAENVSSSSSSAALASSDGASLSAKGSLGELYNNRTPVNLIERFFRPETIQDLQTLAATCDSIKNWYNVLLKSEALSNGLFLDYFPHVNQSQTANFYLMACLLRSIYFVAHPAASESFETFTDKHFYDLMKQRMTKCAKHMIGVAGDPLLAEVRRGIEFTTEGTLVVNANVSCVFPIDDQGRFAYKVDNGDICQGLGIPNEPSSKYQVHALVQSVLLSGLIFFCKDDNVKAIKATMVTGGVTKKTVSRHLTPPRIGFLLAFLLKISDSGYYNKVAALTKHASKLREGEKFWGGYRTQPLEYVSRRERVDPELKSARMATYDVSDDEDA
jgi:hypothetical protein